MSPDQEHRVEEIFGAARGMPPVERTAFLEQACGGDAELRRGVESLLGADEQAGEFLRYKVNFPTPKGPAEKPGDRIGHYRLQEQIGQGGFGVVWMAEQEKPVRRRVALKIIKLGMDTKEVVARFEAERQALAMMDHPNIARVFDGGATETGRPYFVMELVKGVPITSYCDDNKLSTPDRLTLFMQVCHAVQHAHQKGVIHRDLKPSNILVTVQDDKPVPKVIDFGVAKATQAQLTEKTVFTRFHQCIGTPAYMSPEQAGLGGFDVDTRSDVYSLGVLLYELLTGRPPFEPEKLHEAGLDEMRRVIREEEPPTPSNRLSRFSEQDLLAVARQRQAEPPALLQMVRGDLDWIVMKALDKDRGRRYETVGSLAADLRHYLDVEPVQARPPGAFYLLGKMVRRHRVTFVAATAVALSLVIGLTLSTVLFIRELDAKHQTLDQKRNADEQAAVAASVKDFLQRDLLTHGDPEAFTEEKPEPDLTVRTVLDRASEKIEGQFPRQPLVEAGLRQTLLLAYRGLGEYAAQARHARRLLDIYREHFGPTHLETLRAARVLGDAEGHLGRTNEVILLLQQTLDDMKRALGPQHTDTLYTMGALALAYEQAGRTNAGVELLRQAVDLANDQPGPETKVASDLLEILAGMQSVQGNWPEAVENFQRTLKIKRSLSGPESLKVARAESNLAATLVHAGHLAEAEPIARAALEGFRRKLGPEHPDALKALHNLAFCVRELGRPVEAEPMFRELVALVSKVHGETHVEVSLALSNLAVTLECQGKLKPAEEVCRQELGLVKRLYGPEGARTFTAGRNLVQVLIKQQKFAEAEQLLNGIVEVESRTNGPEHTNTLASLATLGLVHAGLGKIAEGTKLLSDTLNTQQRVLGPEHPDTLHTMFLLASVYASRGGANEFEPLINKVLELRSQVLGREHPKTLETVMLRAVAYLQQDQPAKAEPVLKELLEVRLRVQGPENAETLDTMQALARAFEALEEHTKARQVYHELLAIQRRVRGPDDPRTLRVQHDLSHLYSASADHAAAAEAREELLPRERRVLGPDHHDSRCTLRQLGYDYFRLSRLADAQTRFGEALEIQQRLTGPHGLETEAARDALAECLARRGKAAESAALFADGIAAEQHRNEIQRQREASSRPLFTGTLDERLAVAKSPPLTNRNLVAATVNGRPIFEARVRQAAAADEDQLRRQLDSQPELLRQKLDELRKQALERLVAQELIARAYYHEGFEVPERGVEEAIARQIDSQYHGDTNEFLQTLVATGITPDEIRLGHERRLIEQLMRHRKLMHLPRPITGEIEQYYFTHESEFRLPESVALGLIAVNRSPTNTAEANALQLQQVRGLRARLAAGADFAVEARLHSQGSHASDGGDWGWIEVPALRRELAAAATTLPPGELSEVIETPEAFYILRINDRRAASLQPLAEVRDRIEKELIRTQRAAAERRWLDGLRRNALIIYY